MRIHRVPGIVGGNAVPWLKNRRNQRKLALGLLALAAGCFAQALWIEAKGEFASRFADSPRPTLTLVACYIPDTLPAGAIVQVQ